MTTRSKTLLAAAFAAFSALSSSALAAQVWKAGNNDDMNLMTSWWTTETGTTNPGTIGSTDALRFGGSGQGANRTVSLGGNLAIGGIRLDNGTGTPNYNVIINAGNTLTLNGATAGDIAYANAGIVLNSGTGGTLTINADIAIGANQQWVTSRALTTGGGINLNANTLSFNTAGTTNVMTLSGVISGTGSLNKTAGTGTLALANTDNTFSGTVTLVGGTTNVTKLADGGNNSSLGSGSSAIVLNGVALNNTGAGGSTNRAIDMRANVTLGNTGSGTISFTAPNVTQGGTASPRTLTLNGSNSGNNTLGSILVDSGTGTNITALTKNGTGKWVLTGANTYTSTTTINQGTLAVTGTGVLGGATGSTATANNIEFGSTNGGARLEFETSANLGPADQIRFRNTGGTVGQGGALVFTGTTPQTVSKTLQCDTSIGIRLESDSVGGSVTFNGAFIQTNRGLYLGGTGTGDNTLSTAFTGTAGVTKRDAGKWILSGTHGYTGATTVNGGTLAVTGSLSGTTSAAIGNGTMVVSGSVAAPTIAINAGGTLEVSGGTAVADTAVLTLADAAGATLRLASNETIGAFTGGGGAGGSVDLQANTLTTGNASDQTFAGVITGTGGLTKQGGGTLTLSGTNTYDGLTSVDVGTLHVTGALDTAGSVLMQTGTTLSGNGTVGMVTASNGVTFTPGATGAGTLTMSSLDLGTASINIGITGLPGAAVTSSKLHVNGNLTATGGLGSVNFAFGSALSNLGAGTYDLITYTGSQLADVDAFTFSGTTGARQSVGLVNGTGAVRITVAAAYPIWVGLDTDWSSASGNWRLNTDSSDTAFLPGDTVVFDSSAGGGAVELTTDVDPTSTTFSGDTLDYSLSTANGSKITTGTLVKSGTHTLTINNANTYPGGTTLSDGTLVLGDAAAIGTGAVTLSGGTLNLNAQSIGNAMVLAGGGEIDGNGGSVGGVISETGGARTLLVGSSITLSGANTYTGGTSLTAGTLTLGNNSALGSGAATLNGGTLDLNANSITNNVVLAGGGIAGNGGTITGVVSESGGARALDVASNLTLTAASTYTGGTTITAGSLKIGNGGTTGALGTGSVSIATGADLTFNRSNAFSVANVLAGDGSITKKGAGRMSVSADNSAGALHWNFTTTGSGDIGFANANAAGGAGSTIAVADAATGSAFFAGSGNTAGLAISIGTGATFTWNGSTGNSTTLSGVISGAGAFAKVSGENVLLTAVNTFTGGLSITGGGTLQIGGAGQLGAGNYGGNIANANTLSINSTADQTLTGVISGAGALSKGNTGTLTITGTANTQTGNVTVSGGTLDLTTGKLFTGAYNNTAVVAVNGGTLKLSSIGYDQATGLGQLSDYAARRVINGGTIEVTGGSHSTGNDFTVGTAGGTLHYNPVVATDTLAFTGATADDITLNGALTLQATGNISISEVIKNGTSTGSIIKSGTGTLTLSGVNTFTGTTTVTAGTLAVTGTALADGARLTLDGGTVNLTGSETVDTLYFGVDQQYVGTWGATGSGADHIDNTRFSGTGVLVVTNGPVAPTTGYSSWAAVNAPTGTATDDFDGDGVPNGVEFVLGGDKDTNDLGKLPAPATDGTNMTFTFVRNKDSIEAGTAVAIQVDTDLTGWPDSGPDYYPVPDAPVVASPGITVTDNSPANTQTVVLTVPIGTDPAKFARLQVVITTP